MKRNYGVDLLKIIMMYAVILLHVNGNGGILDATTFHSGHYWAAYILEILAYCAVDCYAIISGYVMYNNKYKPSKIINYWFQVIFYSILSTIVAVCVFPNLLNLKNLIKMVTPLLCKQNWYFSSYVIVFLMIPFINKLLEKLENKELITLLIVLFSTFSVMGGVLCISDSFLVNNGYSAIWLLYLYVVGASIKKNADKVTFKSKSVKIILLISLLLTFVGKVVLELLYVNVLNTEKQGNLLMKYNSPTILIVAVCLLILFSNYKIKNEKIAKLIGKVSVCTFGIFLFHTYPLVAEHLLKDAFSFVVEYNPLVMILAIMLISLIIFVIGLVVDLIRAKMFKVMCINKLSENILRLANYVTQKVIGFIARTTVENK